VGYRIPKGISKGIGHRNLFYSKVKKSASVMGGIGTDELLKRGRRSGNGALRIKFLRYTGFGLSLMKDMNQKWQ